MRPRIPRFRSTGRRLGLGGRVDIERPPADANEPVYDGDSEHPGSASRPQPDNSAPSALDPNHATQHRAHSDAQSPDPADSLEQPDRESPQAESGSVEETTASTWPAAGGGEHASYRDPGAIRWYRPLVDWRRVFLLSAVGGVLLLAGAGIALGITALLESDDQSASAPGPAIAVDPSLVPETPEELGFPTFATRNTTRVGGADPTANAAAISLAAHPPTAGVPGPAAVSLVGSLDWQGAVAAAALTAPPIGAPILVSGADAVPGLTSQAITRLAPQGSGASGGDQVFRVGPVAVPDGMRTQEIQGADPSELAAKLDRVRSKLTGTDPSALLIVAADAPEYSVPAAAWAALSGDPVFFVDTNSVPAATQRALARHPQAKAYVLGPEQIVSDSVLEGIEREVAAVERISGESPVTNAIAFARFADGDFGWDVNDPGHGFVIANASRPLEAAVAAPLSATGKPGPLLLTDEADVVPDPLRSFLLDTKPGFVDDPTRAVYNHVWLIGNQDVIGLEFQAQVDDLVDLAPVTTGSEATPIPNETG